MIFAEKNETGGVEAKSELPLGSSSKPQKAKTAKSERRSLQESQRAAKAAAKGYILIWFLKIMEHAAARVHLFGLK